MNTVEETETKRDKGRPATPRKLEQLAYAMTLVRQGRTFSSAADHGLAFLKYDPRQTGYVPDKDLNEKLPGPKRRRIALHQIKREFLLPWERCSGPTRELGAYTTDEITFNRRTLPKPIAIADEEALKRGRPRKR